jgi:hypothetical protein
VVAYQRLERIGLLLIVVLVLFVPAVQSLLFETMLAAMMFLAHTFGLSPELAFVLRHLLVG